MYGSLTNRLNERQASDEIKVGVGATIYMYSDRIACTVIEIKSKCKAIIQRDNAIRIDNTGSYSESQEYRYEKDDRGMKFEIYCRNGIWRVKDSKERVVIGKRDEYYDYTFQKGENIMSFELCKRITLDKKNNKITYKELDFKEHVIEQ